MPPGATALPYVREQATMHAVLLVVMVVETVVVEVLLRALGATVEVGSVRFFADAAAEAVAALTVGKGQLTLSS